LGESVSPKFKKLSPKFENSEERKKLGCDFLSLKKYFGENREERLMVGSAADIPEARKCRKYR